jgi:hypothetical protein
VPVTRRRLLEPVIDGPRSWMGQAGQGLALTRFVLQAGAAFLPGRRLPEAEDGRGREGPRERRGADLGPCGAPALPSGCLGARDQAARGGERLHLRPAVALLDCIAPHAAEARADAGHRVQQIQGMSGRGLGAVHAGQVHVATPRLVNPAARAVDCAAFLHGRIGNACGDPVAVRCLRELGAEGREVILAGGVLARGQECAAVSCSGPAAAPQVAGGPPGGRIARGLREHPAASEHGDVLGGDRVMRGRAAMDGLPGAGLAQDTGQPFVGAEVRQPGPRGRGMPRRRRGPRDTGH